jgi:hypothetical protein
VASTFESLDPDMGRYSRQVWYRRLILALMAAFALYALLNGFGQRAETVSSAGSLAGLEIRAPSRVRSGDIYEARFQIHADRDLAKPALVLAPDWLQGQTLNTLEPSPISEVSTNNELRLLLPPMSAGQEATVWTQWQVNPTGFGNRDTSVTLYDRQTRIVTIDHTTHVFP